MLQIFDNIHLQIVCCTAIKLPLVYICMGIRLLGNTLSDFYITSARLFPDIIPDTMECCLSLLSLFSFLLSCKSTGLLHLYHERIITFRQFHQPSSNCVFINSCFIGSFEQTHLSHHFTTDDDKLCSFRADKLVRMICAS